MKGRIRIGGALLVMMLLGILGCGEKREPAGGHMLDGPGMINTPADQSPFAGTWHSADERVMLEIESGGQFEKSLVVGLFGVNCAENVQVHDLADARAGGAHAVGVVKGEVTGGSNGWGANPREEHPQCRVHVADGAYGGPGVSP